MEWWWKHHDMKTIINFHVMMFSPSKHTFDESDIIYYDIISGYGRLRLCDLGWIDWRIPKWKSKYFHAPQIVAARMFENIRFFSHVLHGEYLIIDYFCDSFITMQEQRTRSQNLLYERVLCSCIICLETFNRKYYFNMLHNHTPNTFEEPVCTSWVIEHLKMIFDNHYLLLFDGLKGMIDSRNAITIYIN